MVFPYFKQLIWKICRNPWQIREKVVKSHHLGRLALRPLKRPKIRDFIYLGNLAGLSYTQIYQYFHFHKYMFTPLRIVLDIHANTEYTQRKSQIWIWK